MNLEEEASKLGPDKPGKEDGSEPSEKMASLVGDKVEFDEDIDDGSPSGFVSPMSTGTSEHFREGSGSVSPAGKVFFSLESVKINGDPAKEEFLVEPPSHLIESPSRAAAKVVASRSSATKGYGLKKWRRIRRDLSKDVTTSPESGLILKRRHPPAEPSKAHEDNKHKNDCELEVEGNWEAEVEGQGEGEGSIASVVSTNMGSTPPVSVPTTLDPDLGLLVAATGFDIGVDSENSDDHSSKSSTAVSAPRMRYDMIGFGRDRSRARNVGGRGPAHVVQQRGQRARDGVDVGNKFRENHFSSKIDIDNSHSSVEPDLRSSNMASLHIGRMASNGKQSEKSVNYDSGHNDDVQPNAEVKSDFYKDNGVVGELVREELDADRSGEGNNSKNENGRPVPDPYFESIASLQATQEFLENEIQNFREMGISTLLKDCDSQSEGTEGINSPTVESNTELVHRIENLESMLEEALCNVKTKESKLLVLEAILDRTEQSNKETHRTNLSFLGERCKEMESELENLLEKKIEAEIEYMIMARTTRSWKLLTEDRIALLEEQKSLRTDQSEAKNAKSKATTLQERAEKLEKNLSESKEVLRLHRGVLKYSLCCFSQMVVLCIAVGMFLLHRTSTRDLAPS